MLTGMPHRVQCRFDLMHNKFTNKLSVHGVTLMLRQNQGFEVGTITMLKKNFGFIKCSERIVDVFFHINALKADSKTLSMGSDVNFLPALDAETGKIIATQLEVIESGRAQFEAVSERRYSGTVKSVAGVQLGHAAAAEGIIVALVDGRTEMLPYSRTNVQGDDHPALEQKVLLHCTTHMSFMPAAHGALCTSAVLCVPRIRATLRAHATCSLDA